MLVSLSVPRDMTFQVKVEYDKDKFLKFYFEADVVDGIVLIYSFSSLVEDIRRTCDSLTSHLQHFACTMARTKMAILWV